MTAPTITPLHEAITDGLIERKAKHFQPTHLTADIVVYTDPTGTDEATIYYEGEVLEGRRDDRWGYVERESWEERKTWGDDADGLLHELTNLVEEHWEITLIEIPEHIAAELLATTIEDVVA